MIDGRGGSNSSSTGGTLGVYVNRSRVNAGGDGSLNITGVSGDYGSNANGVKVFSNISTQGCITTNNGALTIIGISNGNGATSIGACFESSDVKIAATGTGNISITGTADNGTDNATGVYVGGACVTTNSGSLTVNGSSNATGTYSRGVYLGGSANISATGVGNVTITGTAANGTDDACGIIVSGSAVTTSSGSLTVNGTSSGTGIDSTGVYLRSSANISATGAGNVTITGSAPGNTTLGTGIISFDPGDKIYSNAGSITLTANSLNLAGTVNATSAGHVLIRTLGAGVELGGAGNSTTLGLTSTEIGNITANLLTIGNSTTGDITIIDAITFGNLTLITGGDIEETGSGNLTIAGTGTFVALNGNVTLNTNTHSFG